MLPWVQHLLLLLLLLTQTITSDKIDKDLNPLDYYEKNNKVSPLEILLQDDKFLRRNAEKHGYISEEWAGLLADSAATTPCDKNPRLNNPACINNEKRSYLPSQQDGRNTHKYDYNGREVSPALAHTERYILGKRTKEKLRYQELDTAVDNNVIASERERETETLAAIQTDGSPNITEQHATTVTKVGNNTSAHDIVSGSSGRPPKVNNVQETQSAMANKIGTCEPTNSNDVNVTSSADNDIPDTGVENESGPYGRVVTDSFGSANDSQRNTFTAELKRTDTNLINETTTAIHSNINGTYDLAVRQLNESEKSSGNSSNVEKIKELPTEGTNRDADPYVRTDSASINYNESSEKPKTTSFPTKQSSNELKKVGPDDHIDSFNASSNSSNQNYNTLSKTEQSQYRNMSQMDEPRSEPVDPYESGNKLVKDLEHPVSTDSTVEPHQNKTPKSEKSEFTEKMPNANVSNEVGYYGLVEPIDLNTKNATGEGIPFTPATNVSFSSGTKQNQKPNSSETIGRTDTQNETDPFSFTDFSNVNVNNTSRENDTIPFPADSNERSVQHETGAYGRVDPAAAHSPNHDNPESGPYGLVDYTNISSSLQPEDTKNTSSGINKPAIQHPDQKIENNLMNPENILIPQQNILRNESSMQSKDTLQNDNRVDPYGSDVETQKSEHALNNSKDQSNPTGGAVEPSFKILHHARVGNYSSIKPAIINDTVSISEVDKGHFTDLIKNNTSRNENADGLLTPDSESERTLTKSPLRFECPVQLCHCDSGRPVTGFKLIPF